MATNAKTGGDKPSLIKEQVMPSRKLKTIINNRQLVAADLNTSVKNASKLMTLANVGSILVVNNGELAGIFTERDLLKRVVSEGLDTDKTLLKDVMTTNVIGLDCEKPFSHALHLMEQNSFRHVPVLRNGIPVGIVSARDALGVEWQQFEEESKFAEQLFELI